MIEGHGDDSYRYDHISMNFSSNIYAHANLERLESHLCSHIDSIRSYPEPASMELEQIIAEEYGVRADEVLVTSGATDAIYLIAQAFRDRKTYRTFQPTFAEYEDACRMFMYREDSLGNLMWICNPCNPTGEIFSATHIRDLLNKHRYVIVDQSYEGYTKEKLMSAAEGIRIPNVIQIHSLTKTYAIPGLRIGYITANTGIIRLLRGYLHPWRISSLAIEAGKFLLEGSSTAVDNLDEYLRCTQRLRFSLSAIEGIEARPTKTNFILCRLKNSKAADLKEYLAREKGILIRDASNFRGLYPGHFRVASSNDVDNQELIEGIADFLLTRNTEGTQPESGQKSSE